MINLQTRDLHSRALADEGRPVEALAANLDILSDDQSFARAWHGAGLALLQFGENEGALNRFERASQLELQSPWHRHGAGAALLRLGKVEAAERTYLDVLSLDPSSAIALEQLAEIRGRRGDHEVALRYWERASRTQLHNLQF